MNGLNTIETPTINGLRSLTLDQLDTSILSADSIYLSNIETSDIIVDNDIILLANANIIANGATITDVELSYLEGTTSNIQSQLEFLNTKCLNIVGTDSVTTTINNALVLTQNMETPGVLFDSSVTPQIDPFRPADKTKLDDTTLINSSNKLNATLISTGVVSNTEFDYLNGVTSNIQTQIDTAVNYDSRIDDLEDTTQNLSGTPGVTLHTGLFSSSTMTSSTLSLSATAGNAITALGTTSEFLKIEAASNTTNAIDVPIGGITIGTAGKGITFTSGIQTKPYTDALNTKLNDILTPTFLQYTTTDLLNDDLTDTANYVESTNEWSPMGTTKLGTGIYVISLMATLDNINQLNKLRCKIRVKDGTGTVESHYAGTILDNSTNNKQWYYLNITYHFESTDTDNYVTVFSDYYFKPNSSCLCSARLQITRV